MSEEIILKKVDLSLVEAKDLSGREAVSPLVIGKALGNSVYKNMATLDWLDNAKLLHAGQCIELNPYELSDLIDFVSSDGCQIVLMVKVPLLEYLKGLKEQS